MNAAVSARRQATELNGVLLLNKPAGLTSNQALQRVKRLFNARKAGHTGSLDPAATGMLPLCFGEATKICAYLLAADKSYRVTALLGEATDTGDADGTVTETAAVPELTAADWGLVFERFTGEIEQVPPMYSALKRDGKRLYELARQGRTVEREARRVRIYQLQMLEARTCRLVFRVRCSKGTYVRTLVEDLARAAGTVGHTAALHRETVGDFEASEMLDMTSVANLVEMGPDAVRECLLPPDRALQRWPERRIGTEAARRFTDGQAVILGGADDANVVTGPVRVYAGENGFLGVGELTPDGMLTPRRIFRAGS